MWWRRTSPFWSKISRQTLWQATSASFPPTLLSLNMLRSWRQSPSRNSAPAACSSPLKLVRQNCYTLRSVRADPLSLKENWPCVHRSGCFCHNQAGGGDCERDRRHRVHAPQPDAGDGNYKGNDQSVHFGFSFSYEVIPVICLNYNKCNCAHVWEYIRAVFPKVGGAQSHCRGGAV